MERVYDIEQDFIQSERTGRWLMVPGDIKWLIHTVKRQQEILELLKHNFQIPEKFFEMRD